MVGAYAYTPEIWPPLLGAAFLAALGVYSWRRRDVPAATWLAASSLLAVLWLLAIALEAAAVPPGTKIAWLKVQAACQVPAMTAMTCFVLEYTYPGRWLTRRNLSLLWLPPLLALALLVVNGGQLVWRSWEIGPAGSVVLQRTTLSFIVIAYGIGLVLINTAVFLWLFIRSPQHRWPVALMMAAQFAARGLYLLDVAYPSSQSPVDLVVVGIVESWIIYAVALFGFRILDPLPAARQAVMEQMHAAVVVFDSRWRVLSLNPAAETVFATRTGAAHGETWQQLAPSQGPLPALPVTSAHLAGDAIELPEMIFGSGSGARYYAAALSTLKDFRGLLMGHLLMLRNVTEQKLAQTQILEQQRSLAMLHERERLARELHDSIGQVLGYAGLQVETAGQLIEGGRSSDALAQLGRVARVLSEAHADVRQQILDLRASPSPQRPFFEVVQHYLHGFTVNYDIQTGLTVSDELGEDTLPPEAQIGLFRILQEALSNARRHGQARQVRVTFRAEIGIVQMSIEDDGCGFDPDRVADGDRSMDAGDGHFGLDVMRERAGELGGSLRVESAPGRGTASWSRSRVSLNRTFLCRRGVDWRLSAVVGLRRNDDACAPGR